MMSTPTTAATAYESPIGTLYLDATARGLTRCHVRPGTARAADDAGPVPDVLERAVAELDDYFAGRRTRFEVPVDWTSMQVPDEDARILAALEDTVEYGRTVGYAQLAATVGATADDRHPSPAQRVGAAMAANPVLIVVPCHRVVGADGRLTGYAAGLRVKRRLLDLEQGQPALDLTFAEATSST